MSKWWTWTWHNSTWRYQNFRVPMKSLHTLMCSSAICIRHFPVELYVKTMSWDLHEHSCYLLSEVIPKAVLQFSPALEVGWLSVKIKDQDITYITIYAVSLQKLSNFSYMQGDTTEIILKPWLILLICIT